MHIKLYKVFSLEPDVDSGNAYSYAGIRPHKIKYKIQQARVFLSSLNYMEISHNGEVRKNHVAVTFASPIHCEFGTLTYFLIPTSLNRIT